LIRILRVLAAYGRARRLRFTTRDLLEAYQARKLANFQDKLVGQSAYFSAFKGLPLSSWPCMDKDALIANFDAMNTAGLVFSDAMSLAMACERSRDFAPTIGDVTVGLSSGTSGKRGLFAVSTSEADKWAGTILAKALPHGLFAGERVALFLRASSNLYTAVRSPWLTFEFFDLFESFDSQLQKLVRYRPTIVVAPAHVLKALAQAVLSGRVQVEPKRVISVAEVLEPDQREVITQAFPDLHEIYQATEGFLASTCEHGVLHLNEEYLHVEPEWLDEERRRFIPIITDFTRTVQPIVRYRLTDILVARTSSCACGRVTRALDGIEGRCEDLLTLLSPDGDPVTVFPDVLTRALAQTLPTDADYCLVQQGDARLCLYAETGPAMLEAARIHLRTTLVRVGVDVGRLEWTLDTKLPFSPPASKRRRIIRAQDPAAI
jgi:putative adenylate-forming enzyme